MKNVRNSIVIHAYFCMSACTESPNRDSIFMGIISQNANVERRNAQRSTWMKDIPKYGTLIKYKYFLTANEPVIDVDQDDIVLLKGFKDTYDNLSVKMIHMVDWIITHEKGVEVMLKTDDNVYVNVDELVKIPQQHRMCKFYMGYVFPRYDEKCERIYSKIGVNAFTLFDPITFQVFPSSQEFQVV